MSYNITECIFRSFLMGNKGVNIWWIYLKSFSWSTNDAYTHAHSHAHVHTVTRTYTHAHTKDSNRRECNVLHFA